jgi:hypothetical protein
MRDDRDDRHWQDENFTQRMTIKEWKQLLLNNNDTLIFHGTVRHLKAKKIGFGILEIYKERYIE